MVTLDELEEEEIVTDYSVTAIAENAEAAEALAAELKALPLVSKVQPPSEHVPDEQYEKLAVLEEALFFLEPVLYPEASVEPPSDAELLASIVALEEAVAALPDDVDPEARASAQVLAEALAPITSEAQAAQLDELVIADLEDRLEWLKRALEVEEVGFDDLPEEMQTRVIAEDGRALVVALPEEDVSDVVALKRFVEAVQLVAPTATGRPVVEAGIGEIVVDSFQKAIGIALVSILAILLITLRRLGDSLIVLAPIVLAAFFTVAFGVLTGIRFNMANVVAVPLILGLGVDSGIHVFMRFREDGNLSNAIESTTPRAVMLSALTTMGAFSALSLSEHRGMSSLGILLSVSIVALLYCTLVVLPALVEVRNRLTRQR
jgi:predicted RND superfamily exporter protein